MLQSLDDPCSEFLSGDKLKEFELAIEGLLTGIGVEVPTSEKLLVVITPVPGSPVVRTAGPLAQSPPQAGNHG